MKTKSERALEPKKWVTTWSQSLKGIGLFPINDNGHTMQYELPIQNTGAELRLTLGNNYSEKPLRIGGLALSKSKTSGYLPVALAGATSFTIAPKSVCQTDVVKCPVTSGERLFVRLYYAETLEENRTVSANTLSLNAVRLCPGDLSGDGQGLIDETFVDSFQQTTFEKGYAEALELYKTRFTSTLIGVDVKLSEPGKTIVAFGDSITEQNHWVQALQEKVHKTLGNEYSLVNAGISGNRLLKEIAGIPRGAQYFGLAGVDRFEADVFKSNQNVAAVIISLGVNDFHQPGTDAPFPITELPSFEAMKVGFEKLIASAQQHRSKVFLTTLSPFVGYTIAVKNEEKEALRQQVNAWIRGNPSIDGIFDFDQVLADPTELSHLAANYDSGDKLHPSPKGGLAMAEIIDVTVFQEK